MSIPTIDSQLRSNLARWAKQYDEVGHEVKHLNKKRAELKEKMLLALGSLERYEVGGYTISAAFVAANDGVYITEEMVGSHIGGRKAYRSFSVKK